MKETTRCVQHLLYFAAAGLGFSTAFGKASDSFIVHTIYGIMV